MDLDKGKIAIFLFIGGVGLLVVIFAVGFFLRGGSESPTSVKATLNFWGVFDKASAYNSALTSFQGRYPNITINYTSFDSVENYERSLLNALAAGKGPDIFMIRNNDLFRKINKIFPLSASKYTLLDIRHSFPAIVKNDFTRGTNIYALSLSIDTLAFVYNRSIFNEAAIVFPPETWQEFQGLVPKLTEKNESGDITQAGVALGWSGKNVNHSKHILSLLMMQNGAEMVDDKYTSALFSSREGRDALAFYAGFTNPDSATYTWNDQLPNSLDLFLQEKVAVILEYSSALKTIKSTSPFINFEVVTIPQPEDSERDVAYANYWGYTVSGQTQYFDLAWDFILLLTTDQDVALGYLQNTGKPPALSGLITRYINDPELGAFAKQALIARSWAEPDPERVSLIFDEAIESVVDKKLSVGEALIEAQARVTRMMEIQF